MSISSKDNNLKIWNINNIEWLLNLKNVYSLEELYSACFIKNNNQINILPGNFSYYPIEPIKIFDLKGNKKNEIYDLKEYICFIDVYNDNKNNIKYIITGNKGCSKSYDYINKKIYYIYKDC